MPWVWFVWVVSLRRQWVATVTLEEYLGCSFLLYLVLETAKELSKDAAYTPHVDRGVILLFQQDYLWWSIPTRDNVVWESTASLLPTISLWIKYFSDALPSSGSLFLLFWNLGFNLWFKTGSGEAEVTNYWYTLAVNEDIGWLDIPVHDVCSVQEVERTENVVHHGYDVILSQV